MLVTVVAALRKCKGEEFFGRMWNQWRNVGAHPNRAHKAGLCLQVWEVQNQPLTYVEMVLAQSWREPGIAHVRSADSVPGFARTHRKPHTVFTVGLARGRGVTASTMCALWPGASCCSC